MMAKRDHAEPKRPCALSVLEALVELNTIDRTLDAYRNTAPKALDALGGRDALRRLCEPTCIGPVPRLSIEQWSPMAEEHAARQKENLNELAGKRGTGPKPLNGDQVPVSGRGFVGEITR